MKLPHPLASAALARPKAAAVELGGVVVDHLTLARRAAGWAGWLARQGVGPGDTVVLAGPLGLPWLEAWMAVGWLGAAALPLAPEATGPPAWATPSAGGGPRTFVWSPGHVTAAAAAAAAASDDGAGALGRGAWAAAGCVPLAHDPTGWRAPPRPEPVWRADAVMLRLATSGTTGAPRPVELSAGALMAAALGTVLRLGHLPGDRWLCCLPLHHVGGLMVFWRALWGASTVLWQPRFEAAAAGAALYSNRVALAALVPTMLQRVCDITPVSAAPPALRAIMLGGAPASPALLASCRARGLPVAPCWGMSESAAAVACAHPMEAAEAGDCGPPLALARASVDLHGRLSLAGAQLGPLAASAPWATHDVGHIDPSGHVRLAGRGDDVIISGGIKLSPEPIEAALLDLPGVVSAAVVPLPDRQWGQRPAALLVLAAGQPAPELADLRRHVRDRLDGAHVPARAWLCRRLDTGPLGKLRRRAMAEALGRRLQAATGPAPPPSDAASAAAGTAAGGAGAAGLELVSELVEAAPGPPTGATGAPPPGQKNSPKTAAVAGGGDAGVYCHRMNGSTHEDH